MRLGRISYANMAPVFYKVEADVEEVTGVPTELNRMLLDGELDIAPISSIEYARNADQLRILPRLCVSSEGAVDSIQLVTRMQFNQVRTVAATPDRTRRRRWMDGMFEFNGGKDGIISAMARSSPPPWRKSSPLPR